MAKRRGTNGHGPLPTALGESVITVPRTDLVQLEDSFDFLQERIAELEFATEDQGWTQLTGQSGEEREFSREFLRKVTATSRLMFLKNPLINRAVLLQSYYVFGQGINVSARNEDVQKLVQAFMDDPKNRAELTTHQAYSAKEVELQVTGNVFFIFFVSAKTGFVRLRSIPPDEVEDIVFNPEDSKEPWFYKRTWTERRMSPVTGNITTEKKVAYYPDWKYQPARGERHTRIAGQPVEWNTPVHHVKVGGFQDMRFGVPETYAALDWALAYKDFLGDVATIMRALSRFAHKLTVKGGKEGVAAAKKRLSTTVASNEGAVVRETNPPALPGSVWTQAEGMANLEPIGVRGVSIDPEDGRRFLLMVAASMGLPESFFGDVSVGNLATAKSLDRPTELKFVERQTLWSSEIHDILQWAVDKSVMAPSGFLKGKSIVDEFEQELVVLDTDPETEEPFDRSISVDFPPVLEHDVTESINSIVTASTLGGKQLAGTLDIKLVTRLLLQALGVPDIDEIVDRLFPEKDGAAAAPEAEPEDPEQAEIARDLALAAEALRETIVNMEASRESRS